jgi:dTMP kinase
MLIAFEGIDGSGKATQARKLADALNETCYEKWHRTGTHGLYKGAALVSFPRYEQSVFGGFIRKYLKGGYGDLYDNDPFLVSLLYALDRYEFRDQILHFMKCHDIVICDRYVASNMGHQGAKLAGQPGRIADLLRHIDQTEHEVLGLPRADLVFLLDLTAQQSYDRTHKRDEEGDIHQDNRGYLSAVRNIYLQLADTYRCWHVVKCYDDDGVARTIDNIRLEILEVVNAALKEQTNLP